jgi:magnesium-transporting ATPase (P-type)
MPLSGSVDKHGLTGLNSAQVAERLRGESDNELPAQGRRSSWAIAVDVVREPMFLLLVACGVLYLLTGDVGEAPMLLGFVGVVIGITFVQERRTEHAAAEMPGRNSNEHDRDDDRRRKGGIFGGHSDQHGRRKSWLGELFD